MTDDEPRRTKLYGAIDAADHYPNTLSDATRVTTAETPVVGETLERYRIDDVLGRGGMGEVLSARDEQIGRSVAIKRLRVANPTPEVVARFLREARIQGRLEHPAVVPVHEVRTEGDQPFFVMKQLAGTTLVDLIAKLQLRDPRTTAQFSRQRLLRAFVDVCLAIEFAHTRGIIHRDLKPANIVLGDFGEVYVLDWGIARVAGDPDERHSFGDIDTLDGLETVAGAILGTPGYISPEQIRNDASLDGRADVYALGCILFEIVTLEALHPRGQAAIASALAGIDARSSVRAPDREIPPELDWICVCATQMDPRHRFATARELGEVVQRFLDGNRDVALRKKLAQSELATAHASLAGGSGAVPRSAALRFAARALALDPTDREAADLVGRLMLEPPSETPVAVEQELAGLDQHTLRTSARFGVFAALAYLGFFPLLYWIGFRETWYLIAGPAVCMTIIVAGTVVVARNAYWSGYIAIAGNLAMFALFSWMVSPIVIGPGPAIIIVTLLATHRQLIRPTLLVLLTVVATLSPWLLQLAGAVRETTTVSGSDIIVHTAAAHLGPSSTIAALVIYLVALACLAALLASLQDDERRAGRRSLQLQSWQLRQLVPRSTTTEPSG